LSSAFVVHLTEVRLTSSHFDASHLVTFCNEISLFRKSSLASLSNKNNFHLTKVRLKRSSLRAVAKQSRIFLIYVRKRPAIYILTNKRNGTLYVGVTSNLPERIDAHKRGQGSDFTKKYHLNILVHAESFVSMSEAIEREKQIKAGSRKRKLDLIEENNPQWKDIADLL
jgi:putative endonuclease